jgi:hypothetical protein
MSLRWAVFVALVSAILVPFATAKNAASASSRCVVPLDEMRVLASYLKLSAEEKNLTVVVTTTEATGIDIDYANLRLAISGHGTPSDVRNDFKAKQKPACQFPSVAGVPNLRLISKRQYEQLFRARNGWSRFHRRYGRDARLVTLSRVGFDSKKSIALFYATDGIANMAGGGAVYVFRLRDGNWIEESQASVWQT